MTVRRRNASYPATLYSTMDVWPGCTGEELHAAFRRLAALLHPENWNGGDEERYKQLTADYAQLKNPADRKQYDTQLKMLGRQCAGCSGAGWVWRAATTWLAAPAARSRMECQQCEGTGQQPVRETRSLGERAGRG